MKGRLSCRKEGIILQALILKFKYYFSRLIVLIVALHILDVSIDLDYVTSDGSWYKTESYDDIDSFTELIVEKIYNDNNLIKEGDNDDRYPMEKQLSKHLVLYSDSREAVKIVPVFITTTKALTPTVRNSRFLLEDFSQSDYIPPDHSAC